MTLIEMMKNLQTLERQQKLLDKFKELWEKGAMDPMCNSCVDHVRAYGELFDEIAKREVEE